MFLNMKNSFSLFELILTLAISTTIIIYSTLLVKDLIILNKTSLSKELARLELNYTKIFIEKNKNELNKLDSSASTYTQMLWGFNVNMYHAGNNEYIDHLKKIVNDQTEENDKFMYEQLFELETNIDERQELLHTIASRI